MPQIELSLAEAALPGEEAEERQDGALHHSLAREATEVAMTARGTGPHLHLKSSKASRQLGT
jgi:hypothetical protein